MVNEWTALADRLERQSATISELQGSFLSVERDAARWRRAHEIVEQERDTARRERDEAVSRAEAAERERDAAEYAEAEMERERDEWKARADKWHRAWQKSAPARTVTREDVDDAVRTGMSGLSAMLAEHSLREAADAVCSLFGVEAEPADPLLDKAQEFAALADWELTDREAGLLHKVAAHVLGQEQ